MSDRINDGNPSFPSDFTIAVGENLPDGSIAKTPQRFIMTGMSLRDWFAGQALTGLLASGQWHNSTAQSGFAQHISESALEIADAMLVALKGGAA